MALNTGFTERGRALGLWAELFSAATEANEMMVNVLGGFGREISDQERDEFLPRYHAVRDRLDQALKEMEDGAAQDSEPTPEEKP